MPKVNGLELIRQMKAQPTLKRVPIIVISSAEPRDLRQAIDLGARAALPKPVEYIDLLDCLRDCLAPGYETRRRVRRGALSRAAWERRFS